MSKTAIRAVVSVVIIFGALSMLLFATMRQGADLYMKVDEVTSNPKAWYGRNLQLHGFVVDKSIQVRAASFDYKFEIQNNGQVMKATYTGVVPDTFKGGSEVVLKGRLTPDGFVVEPDGVMAKCPSKYDPAGGAAGKSGK